VAVVKAGVARRFDVYLVTLDPNVWSEMRKTRLCVVVSPDEMSHHGSLYLARTTADAASDR
jgi:mRNA-degrading endonuclease toxin of MazEF toxin-antitoxin module